MGTRSKNHKNKKRNRNSAISAITGREFYNLPAYLQRRILLPLLADRKTARMKNNETPVRRKVV